MRRKRRNHLSGFKAKMALEAIKGDRTLAELHLKRPHKDSRTLRDDFWDEHDLQVNSKRVQR